MVILLGKTDVSTELASAGRRFLPRRRIHRIDTGFARGAAPAATPPIRHVFTIVEENSDFAFGTDVYCDW
jgi:hypothetical protein